MGRNLALQVDKVNQNFVVQSFITPPESSMTMTTQAFSSRPVKKSMRYNFCPLVARLITFGGTMILTLIAAYQMYLALPLTFSEAAVWGLDDPASVVLLWISLICFSVTFGCVALTAVSALVGSVAGQDRSFAKPETPLKGKTVLLMPVFNENATAFCASLLAMAQDLQELGETEHFEIFILSDSDRLDYLSKEVTAVKLLIEKLSGTMPVWYRRRKKNAGRKAGNIRDFITQWGKRYDYMIVLDADSLIQGETLTTLAQEMDADSDLGILQTLPRLIGGQTVYSRLQQFANSVYGSVFAKGLNAWQGDDGNYWGHNAIIRVKAFAESAGLPVLSGSPPFGGEIRSHDFVEAALMNRIGWKVRMLTDPKGSWETCPPTLLDAASRDRRWAQGNVQHLAVLRVDGLSWSSRLHMVLGFMNYLTSSLWLTTILIGLIISPWVLAQNSGETVFSGDGLLPVSQIFGSTRMLVIFCVTIGLLMLPKLLGLIAGMRKHHFRPVRDRLLMLISALVEQAFSILYSPIIMFLHTRYLWEIFCGKDSGWPTQERCGRPVAALALLQCHSSQTIAGILMTAYLAFLASPLTYWILPVTIGLMLSMPLSLLSGSKMLGNKLRNIGLLLTREEESIPRTIFRYNENVKIFTSVASCS